MRRPVKTGGGVAAQDLDDVTITEVPGSPEDKPPPGQGRASGRTRMMNVTDDAKFEGSAGS